MVRFGALSTLALLGTSSSGVQAAFSDNCLALASKINITNATVTALQYVQNGTNLTLTGNDPTCTRPYQLIYGGDICRIALNYSSGNLTGTLIEAWLPANWNGRFLATGTGGISGCLQYEDVEYGTSFGFATVGTNAGHNGTGGSAFAISPNVIANFAYRAIHTSAVVGKQLTQMFYGRNQSYSYYLSCSTGGRQGFQEAQMFPNDFNGIVAGAPAINYNALDGWSGWQQVVTGFDVNSTGFVGLSQWTAVHNYILQQCDALDGALDGIIENPAACKPIISSMICGSNVTNTSSCLNGQQAMRVARVYQDLVGSNSTILYPGMQPGAEIGAYSVYWNGVPFPYTVDWFKYAIYNSSFDIRNLTVANIEYAIAKNPSNISTSSPNLAIFNSTGGKILHYHGQQDNVITSFNSARYYEAVAANLSMPPAQLDSFYRYFRIGGMGHCSGGPGAWDIGQKYFGRPMANNTADNNVLLAIVRWVENGTAPTTITGFNYGSSSVYTTNTTGRYSRNHCRYPYKNMKTGMANYTDPNAWSCVV